MALEITHSKLHSRVSSILSAAREAMAKSARCLSSREEIPSIFEELHQQLEEPFSIFVCGEFNSGKSSLLNALAGAEISQTGVTPTTDKIAVLEHPNFGGLIFVDSPGVNSILKEHQEITERYLKRADAVLFVTSVDRPLSESEADFLRLGRDEWGRRVFVVLTKIDLVSDGELQEITNFIRSGIEKILGMPLPVYPVSPKTGAGIGELQRELSSALTDSEQDRLKLSGCIKSISVILCKRREELARSAESLDEQAKNLDRSLKRVMNRERDGRVFLDGFRSRLEALFLELDAELVRVIDNYFSPLSLIKHRVLGNRKELLDKIDGVIGKVNLEKKVQKISLETVQQVQEFLSRSLHEFNEDADRESTISVSSEDPPIPATVYAPPEGSMDPPAKSSEKNKKSTFKQREIGSESLYGLN